MSGVDVPGIVDCIFCGGTDLTGEHIVADWVYRAFVQARESPTGLGGTMVGATEMRLEAADPITKAKVVCQPCNNEWLSQIDNEAASALKSLIQGESETQLDAEAQTVVAAWIFKSALIFEAAQGSRAGRLSALRQPFAQHRRAPDSVTIYVGPAPPVPLVLDALPKGTGLALFGVRTAEAVAKITLNIRRPDSDAVSRSTSQVPIHGFTVMLGRLHAIISLAHAPIIPTPEWDFQRIWPASDVPVTITSVQPKCQVS